jgi:hypothetical protein
MLVGSGSIQKLPPLKIDVFLILDRIKSSKKGLNATGIWKNV